MQVLKPRSGIVLFCKKHDGLYIATVVQNNSNSLSLPKGEIEGDSLQSALRELYEECGIEQQKILPIRNVKTKLDVVFKYDDKIVSYNLTLYPAYIRNCQRLFPYDKKEIKEAKWILLEEAMVQLRKKHNRLPLVLILFANQIYKRFIK